MNITDSRFFALCSAMESTEPSPELVKETSNYVGLLKSDAELLDSSLKELKQLRPYSAAWLAICLGAAVEKGFIGAAVSGQAVYDLFSNWLEALPNPDIDNDEDYVEGFDADQGLIIDAFPLLGQSVVTHLARLDEFRSELSADIGLIQKLENKACFTQALSWVKQLIELSAGKVLVIHIESKRAFEIAYQNVHYCFHLFTLLQTEIGEQLPDGEKPLEALYNSARFIEERDIRDQAWWHYGDPHSPEPRLSASIWGEASVRNLPEFNGKKVILLWPKIMEARMWGNDFFWLSFRCSITDCCHRARVE